MQGNERKGKGWGKKKKREPLKKANSHKWYDITEALEHNTALTTLYLRNNPGISNAAQQLITGYLAKNAVVKAILSGKTSVSKSAYINDIGAAAIAETLKSNTALINLELNNNNVGDSGAAAIAEALKSNTAVTRLYLHNNSIGASGAAAIAEALKTNTALTTLRLGYNNIGDSGAAAIAEALKTNTALTELSLNSNNIGDSGAAALAEALKSNTALTELHLGYNNVTCSNHGTQRTGTIDIAEGDRICKCSGIWSGDICDNAPGMTALALSALAALAWFMVGVVNPKYIRPYREQKRAERAFGVAHPINVTTVGGDAYTLEDWGHCKDLKLALKKLAPPGELGDPSTFVLLDNTGWTAPPGGGGGADATATEVDTKYGSVHRANMMQSAPDAAAGGNGIIEMTLVYKATSDGGVLPARTLREEASPAGGVIMNQVDQSDV